MSIEAVNQFLIKVIQKQQLRVEIARVIKTRNPRQAVTELGAKHGYEFTPEELVIQLQNYQNQSLARAASNELSEEELETVAGGMVGIPSNLPPALYAVLA